MQIQYKFLYTNFDFYSKRYVIYNGMRLKTYLLIYLIDFFLHRYLEFNKDTVEINSVVLKKTCGPHYAKYIQYLIDNNFIFLYKNYSVGYKSKTYKLCEDVKGKYIMAKVNYPNKFISKIELLNTQLTTLDDSIKFRLINDLYRVKIDLNGAINWLENNIIDDIEKKQKNLYTCTKIAHKSLHYTFDKFGRFHTNFTNLKKEVRANYLFINDKKVKEIDIRNSQPFFLYLLMKKFGYTKFDNYDKDVLNGDIYNKMSVIFGISRNETKKKIYSILFGKNLNTIWNKAFKNLYPEVYNFVVEYKKLATNYKIIAHELQKIESDFIFKIIVPKIYEQLNCPLITIHDSIIIQEDMYEEANKIFYEELNKLII